MPPTLESLGLHKLSVSERIALVTAIWDSILEEVERTPLTEAQRLEIDRRLAAHKADPTLAIPWEQIRQDALNRLKQ